MSTNEQLAQALRDAATSLETISRLAGKVYDGKDTDGKPIPTHMGHRYEVRAYAAARAGVARAELARASAAHEAEKAAPTLCRVRTRIKRTGYTLVGTTDYPWTAWAECSPESADDFERSKDPQWEYEVQRLYTAAPAAPASVSEAPVAVPLTRKQVEDVMTEHYPLDSLLRENVDVFEQCVRDLERTLAARWGVKLEGGEA